MSEGSAETWLDGMHRELRELRLRIIALERKRKREIGVAAFEAAMSQPEETGNVVRLRRGRRA
jgi:hypothetical protein